MKTIQLFVVLLAIGIMVACTAAPTKSPDVSDTIRKSLDQAGLKNVSVSQDRDKGVVTLGGQEKDAKAVNSDLDKGIEQNLDAALIQNKLHERVKYEVKSGVVTLTGEVNSQAKRALAEQVATAVPNVLQVVNDLQVKNQKASSAQ